MPEQKPNYMRQLDAWTDANVILPIVEAWSQHQDLADHDEDEAERLYERACETVMKAIREKVLESYRNGQSAGPARPRRFQNKQQK